MANLSRPHAAGMIFSGKARNLTPERGMPRFRSYPTAPMPRVALLLGCISVAAIVFAIAAGIALTLPLEADGELGPLVDALYAPPQLRWGE